jgi:MoxR-like ATPases
LDESTAPNPPADNTDLTQTPNAIPPPPGGGLAPLTPPAAPPLVPPPPPPAADPFSGATATTDAAPATAEVALATEAITPAPGTPTAPGISAPSAVGSDPSAIVAPLAERLIGEIHKAIQGQTDIVEAAVVALLTGGHALFEGVPGTAKTLLVRSLAAACSADFKRIQFTPDLMPSDITGTNVFDMSSNAFHLRRGPIFAEIVLADEINRTPPKTQAALLEAMEERRVSVDGTPNPLPGIFTVFATQNPVEYEGTYPLPEAQLDRFLIKVIVPYPAEDAEVKMLAAWDRGFRAADLTTANLQAVASVEEILQARSLLPRVTVEPKILNYIISIIRRTREHRQLTLGASPRASVALLQASKTLALMRGRPFLTPDDVKTMALPVLRHRVLLRPEAEIEGVGPDRVLSALLEGIEVPR